MTTEIKRTDLKNGDSIYVHGYRGIVSNLHMEEGHDYSHADHGTCIQRYNVTSDPSEPFEYRKLVGSYNGGAYGGCIINDPTVHIDAVCPAGTWQTCIVLDGKCLEHHMYVSERS